MHQNMVKLAELQRRLNAAKLYLEFVADKQLSTELEVAKAKKRNLLQPEMAKLFEAVQTKTHEKSVGFYEALLSGILKDILPGEGNVVLKPEYKNGDTWLDVLVNNNGNLEDVLEANGGALTTVVSIGLQYISLSRTQNRKVLIFDEPAGWLSKDRLHDFFKVLTLVSEKAKFQTFFITHLDKAYFDEHTSITTLARKYLVDSDAIKEMESKCLKPNVNEHYVVKVESSFGAKQWASDSEPGIRAIELKNIRQHTHTLIPCYPGTNCIVGSNNLGKSTALVAASRAISYGEFPEDLLQHGATEGSVSFYLENNQKLTITRNKKKSPAISFSLEQDGKEVLSGKSPGKNSTPDWFSKVLNVSKVEDLDVQVSSQKKSIFLLNETASKRAKLLSIGSEGENLEKLLELYDGLRAKDRECIKKGEQELSKIASLLEKSSLSLLNAEMSAELLATQKDTVEKDTQKLQTFERVSNVYTTQVLKSNWLNLFESFSDELKFIPPAIPTLKKTTLEEKAHHDLNFNATSCYASIPFEGAKNLPLGLFSIQEDQAELNRQQIQFNLLKLKTSSQISLNPELAALSQKLEIPVIVNTKQMISAGTNLANSLKKGKLFSVPAYPAGIGDKLATSSNHAKKLELLLKSLDLLDTSTKKLQETTNHLKIATEMKQEIIDHDCQGVCPTCNQKWTQP